MEESLVGYVFFLRGDLEGEGGGEGVAAGVIGGVRVGVGGDEGASRTCI